MTDQELKTKKGELRNLKMEIEKITINEKIEKHNNRLKALREAAAEAAKPPHIKAKERADRETRVNALLKQQGKKQRQEQGKNIIERLLYFTLWGCILILPFLI